MDELRNKPYGPTRNLIRSILAGGKEVEDAIEAYKQRLNGLKIDVIIDSMNADLQKIVVRFLFM